MVNSEVDLKENYELYHKLKNKTRKQLLLYIYDQPRTYKDLMTFSGLKPGSLYHHLGLLESLVAKIDHGLYKITPLGMKCVEDFQIISSIDKKPTIEENSPTDIDITVSQEDEGSNIISTNTLEVIWLSPVTYIILTLTILTLIFLTNNGIVLAGSAIYSFNDDSSLLISLFSIFIGILLMYYVEELAFEHTKFNRLKLVSFIRLISMVPGVIVGLTIYLLFYIGASVSISGFPIIFALTIAFGTLVAASGIYFLRGISKEDSILYASVPGFADLLIGSIILIIS